MQEFQIIGSTDRYLLVKRRRLMGIHPALKRLQAFLPDDLRRNYIGNAEVLKGIGRVVFNDHLDSVFGQSELRTGSVASHNA